MLCVKDKYIVVDAPSEKGEQGNHLLIIKLVQIFILSILDKVTPTNRKLGSPVVIKS